MRTTTTKDKLEFAFAMARHSTASLPQIQRLMRYAATYGRLQEQDCNVGLTEAERAKEQRIECQIQLLCREFKAIPKFSGDPRGNTVKICVPDGYTNDWGSVGICVPTS